MSHSIADRIAEIKKFPDTVKDQIGPDHTDQKQIINFMHLILVEIADITKKAAIPLTEIVLEDAVQAFTQLSEKKLEFNVDVRLKIAAYYAEFQKLTSDSNPSKLPPIKDLLTTTDRYMDILNKNKNSIGKLPDDHLIELTEIILLEFIRVYKTRKALDLRLVQIQKRIGKQYTDSVFVAGKVQELKKLPKNSAQSKVDGIINAMQEPVNKMAKFASNLNLMTDIAHDITHIRELITELLGEQKKFVEQIEPLFEM